MELLFFDWPLANGLCISRSSRYACLLWGLLGFLVSLSESYCVFHGSDRELSKHQNSTRTALDVCIRLKSCCVALACLWTVCVTSIRKAFLMFCELPEAPTNTNYGVIEEQPPDDIKPPQSPSTCAPDETSPWTPHGLTDRALSMQHEDLALPAVQCKEKLLAAAAKPNFVKRITGEPGCGKTTQVPQILSRAAKNSDGWTMAQIWQCHPFVAGAQSAYHRLTQATKDKDKSLCVSLYTGQQVEAECTWEAVTIATSKIALQRMPMLKEAGLQARAKGEPLPHLMIDEADHEDAWMALLVWVGRTLHRMGLVQLWLISATLDNDVMSIVVVGVIIMDHWSPWTHESGAPGSPGRPEHSPDLRFRTETFKMNTFFIEQGSLQN